MGSQPLFMMSGRRTVVFKLAEAWAGGGTLLALIVSSRLATHSSANVAKPGRSLSAWTLATVRYGAWSADCAQAPFRDSLRGVRIWQPDTKVGYAQAALQQFAKVQ